ncbi:alkaline phosphatase family protein [Nocardioides daeguensis]|uniref:Alkaline phosphatase family protein n=1 Tax=Nocardioides daeguensis TaxID=908359 RepID=A0ABP6VR84_9ACTN|nr:nucleotide pyrophosphatase/phosphodiesterase family protein [Nocardioides daeguensis]MBV6727567.1 alkaline phosphatase family protein [Nocardioides daeguensis]MCR1773211.1 alkaline phosphatase family protein [Nocardioides daeguensis]
MAGEREGAAAFCEPAYGVRSLGDIVPAAAHALGSPLGPAPTGLTLPGASSYVVFLIDGLGARLLDRYAHAAPYLSSLLVTSTPATASVPSTTSTSLTTLGTGLMPGAHGLVGFTTRIPGTNDLLNALVWDSDVDPVQWQPHQTAFSSLQAAGVRVSVVNKREFNGSGLTVAAHRGAEYVGVDRVGERIAAVVAASTPAPRQPALTYVYDGDLDWTGHRWGVASSQWLQQLAMIDHEAEQLREALPADRRLVVIADHGMVDVPAASRVDVSADDDLRSGVALVGGEARFRHLYCTGGAVPDVVATWRERLGERAEVLSRSEAIARGWFGPVDPAVLPRIGDVVVACRGDFAVLSTDGFPYENKLIGMHGSLTADEMLIPVLVD